MSWLSGKKTLIVAFLMVFIGAIEMITTDLSFNGIIGLLTSDPMRTALEGLGLGFLRLGITKSGG